MIMENSASIALHRVNTLERLIESDQNARILQEEYGNVETLVELDIARHHGKLVACHRPLAWNMWRGKGVDMGEYLPAFFDKASLKGLIMNPQGSVDIEFLGELEKLVEEVRGHGRRVMVSHADLDSLEVLNTSDLRDQFELQQLLWMSPFGDLVKRFQKNVSRVFEGVNHVVTWCPLDSEDIFDMGLALAPADLQEEVRKDIQDVLDDESNHVKHSDIGRVKADLDTPVRFFGGAVDSPFALDLAVKAMQRYSNVVSGVYVDEHSLFSGFRTDIGKSLADARLEDAQIRKPVLGK